MHPVALMSCAAAVAAGFALLRVAQGGAPWLWGAGTALCAAGGAGLMLGTARMPPMG